mgnify:CR=1 FL=1
MSPVLRLVLCSALLSSVSACTGPPPGPPLPPTPSWTAERSAAAEELATRIATPGPDAPLVVRLAFSEAADLDLYVTGPLQETVYYANTPSKVGGALLEDRRCTHPGTRIETITFPAVSGRYRVGVDYPRACRDAKTPAPFALRIDLPDGPRTRRGIAVHHVFEPIVIEFEVDFEAPAETATGSASEVQP